MRATSRYRRRRAARPAEKVSSLEEGGLAVTQRMVKCVKFQKEMPGLAAPPLKGELGQRIYENVSQEAWNLWKEHMKMVVNEYQLNLGTPEAQEIILKQMEDYFFGAGAALPPGYVPQQAKT